MQWKSEPPEAVLAEGEDLQRFMFPVNSLELKDLLSQSEDFGREPRNSVQLDDAIVKLFQEAFKIDIKTCTEDEWTERISNKGGSLKQWQSSVKDRKDREIVNSGNAPWLFIALSALLLIGLALLPKSPVPVSAPGSSSPTTQISTVK